MILSVRELAKVFRIHHLQRTIPVFDGLSFDLCPGQFLLVSGSNGAGKSTLLRCLYRSYLPSAGSACYDSLHGPIDLARAANVDVSLLRRTEIGFVTQFLHLRPRVSAIELVAEPLLNRGIEMDQAIQEATAWLDALSLKREIWQAYPATFSGGEQQKVNLARALIAPRRLLLLDEPTASLDAATRAALVARLGELKAAGVAMIGVFHHPDDVEQLIDKVIDLNQTMGIPEQLPLEGAYVAD